LTTVQGKVKQVAIEVEEKIIDLIMQGEQEITTIEDVVFKEVEVEKDASQNFISSWKNMQQA